MWTNRDATGTATAFGALAVLLAAATAVAFAVASAGPVGRPLPAVTLGAVVVAVALGSGVAGWRSRPRNALLVGVGPVGGFGIYLVGYRLRHPPSADSPTPLLFLGFAGGVLAVAGAGYAAGSGLRRLRDG